MPSTYLITNQDKVFVYPVSSGLVFPGSSNNEPPNFKWLNVKSSRLLGPAGFLWEQTTKVSYYEVPVTNFQAEMISSFLNPVNLRDAWSAASGSLKSAIQLIIDPEFFQSLENDIELYVLSRIHANNGLTVKQLAQELNVEKKIAKRGLDKLIDGRNFVCPVLVGGSSFLSQEYIYKLTSNGVTHLLKYSWTPENTSQTPPVLPRLQPRAAKPIQSSLPVNKYAANDPTVLDATILALQAKNYELFHTGAAIKNIKTMCGVPTIKAHLIFSSFVASKKIPPVKFDEIALNIAVGQNHVLVRDIKKALISESKDASDDANLVERAVSRLKTPIPRIYVEILLNHLRAAGAI